MWNRVENSVTYMTIVQKKNVLKVLRSTLQKVDLIIYVIYQSKCIGKLIHSFYEFLYKIIILLSSSSSWMHPQSRSMRGKYTITLWMFTLWSGNVMRVSVAFNSRYSSCWPTKSCELQKQHFSNMQMVHSENSSWMASYIASYIIKFISDYLSDNQKTLVIKL